MRPAPHRERIIDKDDAYRLIVRTNLHTLKAAEETQRNDGV
jgi:hypothetical protein